MILIIGNKIPKGETTTVHLLIKEGVPAEGIYFISSFLNNKNI